MTKNMYKTKSMYLFWLVVYFVPLIAFLIYGWNQPEWMTFSEFMTTEFGSYVSESNIFYGWLTAMFTESGSIFFGVNIDTGFLIYLTFIANISIIRIVIDLIWHIPSTLEALEDKFCGVGGIK